MRRAVVVAAIAGCGTPTPQLAIDFSGESTQVCPATQCEDIKIYCEMVMNIRMVDPEDPTNVFYNQCVKVLPDRKNDACPLRGVALDPTPIPVRKLDVQVAVYPASEIPADPVTGELICPDPIEFNVATGYPVEKPTAPALGGRTWYHPGDQLVDVVLGCTDLAAINAACAAPKTQAASATVIDFDTRLPVTVGSEGVADRLWVSVGEPHMLDGAYVLNARDTIPLRLENGTVPKWKGSASPSFTKYACVEVLEDVVHTTAALRCTPMTPGPLPEQTGVRISRETLDGLVKTFTPQEVPAGGLTVGMVVDRLSNGVPGYSVTSTAGTVIYPGAGGPNGSQTSASGIFLSRDAPFGTKFSAISGNRTVTAIGGLVAGKVTVVIVPVTEQ